MFYNYKDLKLNYETIGNGKNIVFLHGWQSNKDIFQSIIKDILDKYKITLIDLPSFGLSKSSDKVITVFDISNVLISFFKEMNITNPILVGHSYGGKIASIISTKISVEKLILIDTSGIKRINIKNKFKIFIYKLKKKYYKLTKQIMKYNTLIKTTGSTDYINANPLQKEMLKSTVNTDIKKIFKKISCETLILWGEFDKTTKLQDGKLIHKLIKNSELIIIPNSSHFPFIENKTYFIKVFNSYLGV